MITGLDIVENGQVVEKANILECSGNTRLIDVHNRFSCGILSVKNDRTSGRVVYFGEKVKDGCLACTVGTDQTDDLFIID